MTSKDRKTSKNSERHQRWLHFCTIYICGPFEQKIWGGAVVDERCTYIIETSLLTWRHFSLCRGRPEVIGQNYGDSPPVTAPAAAVRQTSRRQLHILRIPLWPTSQKAFCLQPNISGFCCETCLVRTRLFSPAVDEEEGVVTMIIFRM